MPGGCARRRERHGARETVAAGSQLILARGHTAGEGATAATAGNWGRSRLREGATGRLSLARGSRIRSPRTAAPKPKCQGVRRRPARLRHSRP
eukprot:scaffold2052_cov106-Isochrysis_galbana.AAC.2